MKKMNKIYAYSSPNDKSRVGQLKVGDTKKKSVSKYLRKSIGANRSEFIIHTVVYAVDFNGRWFRDYEVHRELESMGIERKDGEWFVCDKEDVNKAIHNITKKPVFQVLTPKVVQQYLMNNHITPSLGAGYRLLNLDYAMRIGKTPLMLNLAKIRDSIPM